MSRPLVWNGTTWKDPSFHVGGGAYKTYQAPVYDVWAYSTTFPSNAEGWTFDPGLDPTADCGWYPGDASNPTFVYGATTQPSIFRFLSMRSPTFTLVNPRPSTRVGVKFAVNNSPITQQTLPLDVSVSLGSSGSWSFSLPPGGWPEYTSGALYTTPSSGNSSSLYVGFSAGQSTDAAYMDEHFQFGVDSVTLWDLDRNEPLKVLGTPGWEPKVRRLDGTWK